MRLNRDESALESLPLKLMIVAVVASISIVPASHALQGLENKDFVRKVGLQLDMIVSTAQLITTEGPGAVRTIVLDLRGAGALDLEWICIGDRPGGANASSVIMRLTNGGSMIRSASDPPVELHGEDGSCLVVTCPMFDLRMEAKLNNWTVSVLVEVV